MPLKKKLIVTSISITAVILIIITALFITFKLFKISYNVSEKNEIDSQITITRDSKGIPHIDAGSVNDFFFALGYLHASDRLDVMEYLRAIASGETDKFAGHDSGILNNLSKTIGFTKNADDIYSKLSQDDILPFKYYVMGINHVRGQAHVRTLINRDWNIQDVLAIMSMKEWANSYLNNVELIFNLPESKIQDSKTIFLDSKYLHFYNEDDIQYLYILRRIKEITEKYICSFLRGLTIHAGNEYTPNESESYTTINYEDQFNIFPGWYPVKATENAKKILAITYKRLPFLYCFKNQSISLTHININADSQNFYFFDTDTKNNVPQYKSAGSWKEYKTVRIPAYKNSDSAYEIKWFTDKGPVISELINSMKSDSRILVLESVQPGNDYIHAMMKMPFETNIEKTRQLALLNDSSLKCFLLNDNTKSYKIYSGIVNQTGNNNRIFIDGSQSLKPPMKHIAATIQIKGIDYAGSDLFSPRELPGQYLNTIINTYKKERVDSLLLKKKMYNEDTIREMITDDKSVIAEKFIPLFKQILENNVLTSAKLSRIYFSDWDYSINPGLQSPSIFYTVLHYFIQETYKDKFGRDADFNLASAYLLYPELYENSQKKLTNIFDNTETLKVESREMIFDIAFLNAMRFLNRKAGPYMDSWRWGSINRTNYFLYNVKSGFLSYFFNVEDKPHTGGPDTLHNLMHNNKFSSVSSTSINAYITADTIKIRMNTGYSLSLLSDFFYGKNSIDNFENLDTPVVIYKTIINKK
jgi:penicillin amidase